jgi:hypothetical protein
MTILQAIVQYVSLHEYIVRELLPKGSGFDDYPAIVEASDSEVIIVIRYHPLNEDGYYEGWIEERLHITPSIIHTYKSELTDNSGAEEGIREYILDTYHEVLSSQFDYKKAMLRST